MKKHLALSSLLVFAFLANGCGPKATSQSNVDTPESHYRAGMRYLEDKEYNSAIQEFNRSIALDKKFALGWAGLGLATGLNGDLKQGLKQMDKGLDLGKKNADVHVLAGRLWIAHRGEYKKWHKKAVKEFENALDRDKRHEGAQYYMGEAHFYNYDIAGAEAQFRLVIDLNGDYSGKADSMWELSDKINRAKPGTAAGKKVALVFEITRADLAALFVEELKLTEIFNNIEPSSGNQFVSPTDASRQGSSALPPDVRGHWAEGWIRDALNLGVMEAQGDGNFHPEETVKRLDFAMAVARMLVAISGDPGLETRYFGEPQSRFSDVSSTHPAYSAMALCSER
ncbi:MAG: S-layer homology domain-containing protein, partial [Candidatus Marinimicrobia bacterium]|nr:S-layer homology domain-containing protein [Candidatus Neomarinimicrobiota bacterium]